MTLNADEKKLAAAIGFEEDVCDLVKELTGGVLERLTAVTEEYEQQDSNGISVRVDRQDVETVIARLQRQLTARGYRAFWSEVYESNGLKEGDEIAVLKSTDHYDIIRIRRPNGANYGVSMDDILAKLREWEVYCRLRVFGAARDWVAVEFETFPESICAFAEDVYEFCPDTVEQGVGLAHESEEPEKFQAARELCPELSDTMRQ
jgi:hypothetical protein